MGLGCPGTEGLLFKGPMNQIRLGVMESDEVTRTTRESKQILSLNCESLH